MPWRDDLRSRLSRIRHLPDLEDNVVGRFTSFEGGLDQRLGNFDEFRRRALGFEADTRRRMEKLWPPRPRRWEDDISRSSAGEDVFEVGPTVNDLPLAEHLLLGEFLPDEVLRGRDLRQIARRDTSPIPVGADREGYFDDPDATEIDRVGFDLSYWLSGLAHYLEVVDALDDLGVEFVRCSTSGPPPAA